MEPLFQRFYNGAQLALTDAQLNQRVLFGYTKEQGFYGGYAPGGEGA